MTQETKPRKAKIDVRQELGQSLFYKLFKISHKLYVVFWLFANGEEIGFWQTTTKLEAKEIEYKGKKYQIDSTAIQNRLGKLTINIDVHNAIGALRWVRPEKSRDPENTRDLFSRGVLSALWHSWKLPFILLIVMAIGNIILGMGLAIIFASYNSGIATIEAQKQTISNQDILIAQLRNATQTNNDNGGKIGGDIVE